MPERWPFLYGREASLLIMARWSSFIFLSLVLYYYVLQVHRAVNFHVSQGMSRRSGLREALLARLEAIPLLLLFSYYVGMVFLDLDELLSQGISLALVNVLYSSAWLIVVLRRQRRSARTRKGDHHHPRR